MLIVAALGGNAMLQRGEPLTEDNQRENIRKAAKPLADLVRAGHQLVVTHGNGPQVGLLALQGIAYKPDELFSLDVLGAESEGMIGYMIEQELENELDHSVPVATLLTQVIVDADDPAFSHPTKFIGPVYDQAEAETRAEHLGWDIARDGDKWRRVVASPAPAEIPDLNIIRFLIDKGAIAICAGGGGIPVIRRQDGSLTGVEAVIDKDAVSARLATEIGADRLLLLTDVDGVYRNFGQPDASRVAEMDTSEVQNFQAPAGSMGPKLSAARNYASQGGMAVIGNLKDALAMIEGDAGTRIRKIT
ncbi:carbamate kinase [Marinobacter santoriniensis NKSG1]|uniref:Carbamate kinase n=1 Tax=Marinobacter santoriniensis NKSG1 TaxID=1288826 RepID=M7D1E7_9GAMM|nr:carbamate kinase [Marinobacter santoriniensis]EMP54573.1 carbamate kinase [Marinobacter santoriniensis NKSG1]